jgi:hypothetical protein
MELKTLRWEDDPGLSERAINIITFIFSLQEEAERFYYRKIQYNGLSKMLS